jgi:ketopantoate reductase
MRFVVVGAGAVGGVLGARLALTDQSVVLVGRMATRSPGTD